MIFFAAAFLVACQQLWEVEQQNKCKAMGGRGAVTGTLFECYRDNNVRVWSFGQQTTTYKRIEAEKLFETRYNP